MTGSKIRMLVVVALAVILATGALFAIKGSAPAVKSGPKPAPMVARATGEPTESNVERASFTQVPEQHFASTSGYDKMAAANAAIKPNVPAYQVQPGLANVANRKLFDALLEPKVMDTIARNGFAVTPTDFIQMFYIYENNEYQRPQKFPSFITTDSMLHIYHVFYDYSLREVEAHKLYDAAVELTDAMLAASEEDYARAKSPEVKRAARGNVTYFAVARNLLTGKPAPSSVKDDAAADLALIDKHEGKDVSKSLGVKVDFSQFVPRGHYTRSEKLKKYFKGMMWYGLTALPIPEGDNTDALILTRQAAMITRNLSAVQSKGKPVSKLWDMIYEPTAFYVGTADDHTYYDYSKIISKLYGTDPGLEAFSDNGKLQALTQIVSKLPPAGIDNSVGDGLSSVHQFRFMGQRFIPDSRIFKRMTDPYVSSRGFPRGLDAFAAMGSDRALAIMKTLPSGKFDGYDQQMAAMRKETAAIPKAKWQSNLYYGWLWSLRSVVEPAPAGYPSFMRNEAWVDKSLWTGLGSWTELRHDTILYAKQSDVECGGAEDEPVTPRGYVEPNLEFWTRLKWLNQYTEQGLSSRGLLTEELKDKFDKFDSWLTFCRNITIKELTGKKVTEEEYEQICIYGADLESLTTSFAGGDLISDTDKDMAIVADVHTDSRVQKCLEEGTGRAGAIYVVVPIEGKLYLTRGATYTHYEFEWPISDRLTDESWQKMLQSGKTPSLAPWVKSFFMNTKKKPAKQFEAFSSGC